MFGPFSAKPGPGAIGSGSGASSTRTDVQLRRAILKQFRDHLGAAPGGPWPDISTMQCFIVLSDPGRACWAVLGHFWPET